MIVIYWGYKLILLSIYGVAMWFVYRKFLKAKITSKAIKILIISILCLLPFGDRIAANIEGHYYLLTTPKPKDDIEVSYPFSLYYDTKKYKNLDNLMKLEMMNCCITSITSPFNLDGYFINKIIVNGDDGFLHMFSRDISGIDDDIKNCLLKSEEVKNNFLGNDKDDLFIKLRNIEICEIARKKIIAFSTNDSEKIFSKNNILNIDYTFTRETKKYFFVSVYDEKIVDNKTNEIVYTRREVYPNNKYWLLLHDAQALITSGFHLRIGSKFYTNKFKSIFIYNPLKYTFKIYEKFFDLKY